MKTHRYSLKEVRHEANSIARAINAFDPSNWDELWDTTGEIITQYGGAFQAAMNLYGILSLPPYLAAAFACPHDPAQEHQTGTDAAQTDRLDVLAPEPRKLYLGRLRVHFKELFDADVYKVGLMRLCGVMGAAAYDDSTVQGAARAFLVEALEKRWSEGGAARLHTKLEEFWASGRTSWDECFYEMIRVIG